MTQAATKASDFDELAETGSYVDEQWDHLIKILHDLWAVHQGHEQGGTPGDGTGFVSYWYIATSDTVRKAFRVGQDGTDFRIDKNTGTDASPSWTNMLKLNISTLAATLPAGITLSGALAGITGLTLTGDLDLSSNDVLNVNALTAVTVNGVDPASHASRHAPGGSDAISTGTPVDVGSANAAGSASTLAKSDHVHAGVTEIDVNGGSNLQGAVDIVAGDGIKLAVSGNQVTLSREREHTKIGGGDDTHTSGAGEIIVQDSAGTPNELQVQLTGADGSKDWLASFSLTVLDTSAAANAVTIRVRVGSLGTTSDAVVKRFDYDIVASKSITVALADLLIAAPAANDYVSVTIAVAGNATIRALTADAREPELEVKAVAA